MIFSCDWHLFVAAVTVTCSGTVILSSVLFSPWQDWWQLYKRPVIFVLYKSRKLYPLSNMGG